MNPAYQSVDPGPLLVLLGLVAAAVPGFLASWKHPGMAFSAIFMSFCSVVFAINGSKLTGDVVFAAIWSGAMLLAGLSRALDGISEALSKPALPRNGADTPNVVDKSPVQERVRWLSQISDPLAPPPGTGDLPKGPLIG